MTATIPQPDLSTAHDAFPIHGTDYIEYWVGNAKQSMLYYCYAFGYELIGYRGPETGVRDRASYLLMQDKIRLVLTTPMGPEGEIAHAIESPAVQRFPLQLEWVVNQYFEIDHYQPLLFVVDSFEHLYAEIERLIEWVREGRLDHVSPGEPAISEADLRSFLVAARSA